MATETKQKLREIMFSILEAIYSVLPEHVKNTLLLYFEHQMDMFLSMMPEYQALKILIEFEKTVCNKVCNCGGYDGHSD